jgi:hypothetical protein
VSDLEIAVLIVAQAKSADVKIRQVLTLTVHHRSLSQSYPLRIRYKFLESRLSKGAQVHWILKISG